MKSAQGSTADIALLTGALALLAAVSCSYAPVLAREGRSDALVDGEYEGRYRSFPNSAHVAVRLVDGRIAAVELLHHGASWVGARAAEPITERIVAEQSAQVDAVSGATNSSVVIMNAVQDALDKARPGNANDAGVTE